MNMMLVHAHIITFSLLETSTSTLIIHITAVKHLISLIVSGELHAISTEALRCTKLHALTIWLFFRLK